MNISKKKGFRYPNQSQYDEDFYRETFHVTIVTVEDRIFEVKATIGNP